MTAKKLPTIYQIKRATLANSPHYFTRDTMRYFGQTLKGFKVEWANKEKGIVYLWAKRPSTTNRSERWYIVGDDRLFVSYTTATREVDNAAT